MTIYENDMAQFAVFSLHGSNMKSEKKMQYEKIFFILCDVSYSRSLIKINCLEEWSANTFVKNWFPLYFRYWLNKSGSWLTFACSNSTKETLETVVKHVQS